MSYGEAASLVSFEYGGRVVRLSFKNVSKAVRVHIGFPFDVNLDGVRYALSELPSTFPLLETLFLGRNWNSICVYWRSEYLQTEKLAEETQKQESSHNNLKEIDIYGFKGYDNEIELTKCLLKIATALQKMEIYTDIPRLYQGNGHK
ncbi:hypothetical protein FRX31_019184 [Thalictrum thalictroides]|uniref:FBD domain-containing protein n=1 Tax=Thalictrum thalictroides TaxID=46969 RepID=A0A7J6W1F8_THATH|nr:hypothetical protein FRX31_019184 [Thalictrum thalictroides]